MLGLRRIIEANVDEINRNICKTSGCGWRKRSIIRISDSCNGRGAEINNIYILNSFYYRS